MRRPPVDYLYYNTWFFLTFGIGLVGVAPFDRAWQPLALGLAFLLAGTLNAMFLAWWRRRYSEWQAEIHGRSDETPDSTPRSQVLSDRIGTWAINVLRR